ncbi:ferrous iron transport protein A [Corallincola platygyrae]|uniref:Ferrous iron transport protein A n=1 Tax=Corallincola platygyrae TaxID=1193278 RepID=A0ABW4XJ63_9GAMM
MHLSDLSKGQHAVIRSVAGANEEKGRLMDLGLIPGATIQLVRHISLSQSLQVDVKRARLVVRKGLAKLIDVQVVS